MIFLSDLVTRGSSETGYGCDPQPEPTRPEEPLPALIIRACRDPNPSPSIRNSHVRQPGTRCPPTRIFPCPPTLAAVHGSFRQGRPTSWVSVMPTLWPQA